MIELFIEESWTNIPAKIKENNNLKINLNCTKNLNIL